MKKSINIFLTVTITAIIMASVSACAREEPLPTLEDILPGALQNMGNIQNYELDVDIDIRAKIQGGENEGETVYQVKTDGLIDLEMKNLKMYTGTYVIRPPDTFAQQQNSLSMYILDGTLYLLTNGYREGSQWVKADALDEYWDGLNFTASQKDFLSSSNIKVTGREKINEIDCYILEITPDTEQLKTMIAQQLTLAGQFNLLALLNDVDFPEEISLKQWLAEDSLLVQQGHVEVELTVPADESTEEIRSLAISFNMQTTNHNQPVSIQLPPDAKVAVSATGE